MLNRIRHYLRFQGRGTYRKAQDLEQELRNCFAQFNTSQLQGINPAEFRSHIESQIGTVDAALEGYKEEECERQRDLSIKFHWGHDHDFGDFVLSGRMGDHHIRLIRDFCCLFPIGLEDFRDRDVLDIGCWTGGTSLMLTALGSRVVAIEEVRKYAEMISFLSRSFGIDHALRSVPQSLYACNAEEFREQFDIVYFPGVLYHLSDPVVALRILYNACRVGGFILLQSQGIKHAKPYCRFEGSYIYTGGDESQLNRGGWNWFLPSCSAVCRMLREVGFEAITGRYLGSTIYAYGKKTKRKAVCRAGLSVPDLP